MTASKTRCAALFVFVLCLALYSLTMSPGLDVYHTDSPEFVIGAHTLGIIHAPGYPLYLLIAHLFTHIPIGSVAARVNALSVLSLALTAPLLLAALARLTGRVFPALAATLTVMLSGYVWHSSVSAEIYAPQMLTLATVGYLLTRVSAARPGTIDRAGVAYGVALALTPASVLLGPGVAGALWLSGASWWRLLRAGTWAGVLAVLPWVYFPLRYMAGPTYNLAGVYGADGAFRPVDLATSAGVWWQVSGGRFRSLYFADGGLWQVGGLFAENLLWVGVALVIVGGLALFERSWRGLLVWTLTFGVFAAFYVTYGAADKATMLGPGHLLLAIPVAFGWDALAGALPRPGRAAVLALIPLVLVSVNLPIIHERRGDDVRMQAARTLAALPPESVVFGRWEEATPLQYLQQVEAQRPDVTVYNLFLFSDADFEAYLLSTVSESAQPVFLLSEQGNSPTQREFIAERLVLEPLHTPFHAAPAAYRVRAGVP